MSEGILINPGFFVYFATITVTYPSGSTVTCTCGSDSFTAETTSGSYTFVVPYAGTWTVKATQGSNTASTNVSVTTYNQAATCTLTYNFIIYNGADRLTFTTWANSHASVTIGDDFITTYSSSPDYGEHIVRISTSSLPLSQYTTVKCTGYITTSRGSSTACEHIGFLKYQSWTAQNCHTNNCVSYAKLPTSNGTISLPIPTSGTFDTFLLTGNDCSKVSKIWLE